MATQDEPIEMDDRKDFVGTARDAQEMDRLGKQQVLNVCHDKLVRKRHYEQMVC